MFKNENGSSALRDEIRNQIATDCVTEAGRHTSSHATDLWTQIGVFADGDVRKLK